MGILEFCLMLFVGAIVVCAICAGILGAVGQSPYDDPDPNEYPRRRKGDSDLYDPWGK